MAGAGAALTAVPIPLHGLGTAGGIGRSLVEPQQFANGPLPWKRVQIHSDMKTVLGLTLQKKWSEATSGPPRALPELLAGGDEQFRQKLLLAQGACPDIKPQLQAATKLLEAGSRDKIKEEEELAKSYRLSPLDGVLEREVFITKVLIWVPVMPSTVVPREYFGIQVENLTWRRFAFEQAHMTFLEPHRTSGATWQTLKRIAFWQTMKRDFEIWIFHCAVCHQYRTVGTLAPMRSILASVDESLKLPWNDVIIDCQGPFTRSAKGRCYTVSYHCVPRSV